MRTPVGGCILGLLLMLSCGSGRVEAQPVPEDSASQRILPLPESKLSDVQTQMQLLQKLRSLVASPDDKAAESENPSLADAPGIDDEQLEQLQKALKKLQDQLPPGIKPPDLNSIPTEQLDEAMSNPAMQQQLKKMLEQFSKDGLLPKNDGDVGDSSLPPVPQRPGQFPIQPPKPESRQTSPPAQLGEQSWESLKNAMKKLSEIAQSGKNKSPQNDESIPGVDPAEDRDDASPRMPPIRSSGDEQQPRTDQSRPDRNDAERNDAERSEGDPGEDEAGNRETPQPSLQAFHDLLKRYKDSQRSQPPSDDGTSGSEQEDTRLPEVRPGIPSPRAGNEGSDSLPNPSKRVIRRPDRATPLEPPFNSGPRTSEQGEVFPPAERLSDDRPLPARNIDDMDPRSDQQARNSSGSDSSGKTMPSVSEFLKEQFRKGFPTPGTSENAPKSQSPGMYERPGSKPPHDTDLRDSPQPGTLDPAPGTRQSKVDIRSELQKIGVRGTLDKLIEKVKEDSITQRRALQQAKQESTAGQPGTDADQNGTTTRQEAQTQSPPDAGLRKTLADLLGGMDDKMEDIIQDAKFEEQTAESRQSRDSTWQQSPGDADSGIHKWNDAASDFLSDLSTAPSAPTASRSSSGGDSSVSEEAPLAIGSFFLVALGLMGLIAVAAFMMRRPLLKLVSDAAGIAGPGRIRQPSDIRSREDVITAFHELALNPRILIESWWTHRAAATKLAAESPQQGNAVRTLAEIYEQARYLPDDVELPAEKIQSARTALAECR